MTNISDAERFYREASDQKANTSSHCLMIVFGGLDQMLGSCPDGLPPFEFCNILKYKVKPDNCSVLFVRDRQKCWYLRGVHGESEDVHSTVAFFQREADRIGVDRIITLGSSMGGYAAILYGHLLHAEQAIAFGPQLFLDKSHRNCLGDSRWKTGLDDLSCGLERKFRRFLNVRNLLPFNCAVTIHCGARCQDIDQAKGLCSIAAACVTRVKRNRRKEGLLAGMGIVGVFAHEEGGHAIVTTMRNNGNLELLLKQIISTVLSATPAGVAPGVDLSYGGKDLLQSALQAGFHAKSQANANGPLLGMTAAAHNVHITVALQFASKELQANRKVVLAAVTKDGSALQFAHLELQADQQVAFAAVTQHGAALQFAAMEMQSDRQVALAAVLQDGTALQFASKDLRADRQVVLAAVMQDGIALQFANTELRATRKVVLAAVAQDGAAQQFASDELLADAEVLELTLLTGFGLF